MNYRLSIRLSAMLLIAIMMFASVAPTVKAQNTSRPLTILFTHDLHSHFDSNKTAASSGKITESGGFDHLAGVIQREKAKNQAGVLVVDAGDFSMGTLFHTLFAKEASELRLLGAMGYDATTIGNHEFDFDSSGLASMLNTARAKEGPLPSVVSSNLGFKSGQEWKSGLKKARQDFPVQDYKIVEKNGMRIGIFGLLGSDAAHDLIWGDDIQLQDPAKEALRVVKILREREKVDLIVCLSHSGTSEIKSKSEDELLAQKVPGIDVIISGHTHTRLDRPIKVGKTIIASSGCFGDNMGILVINCPKGQDPNLISYRIEKIVPDTPAVRAITNQIGNYKTLVNGEFLQDSGYTYDQILGKSQFDLESFEKMESTRGEFGLGNLIADSFRT
ncbi:MAG: bifunctional metallophosphatase/5'-nucleotidase, partial [Ignavibacteriales bacterium]